MRNRLIILSVVVLAVIACGQTVKVDPPPTLTAYLVPPPTDSAGVEFRTPTPAQTAMPTMTPQVWRFKICDSRICDSRICE